MSRLNLQYQGQESGRSWKKEWIQFLWMEKTL